MRCVSLGVMKNTIKLNGIQKLAKCAAVALFFAGLALPLTARQGNGGGAQSGVCPSGESSLRTGFNANATAPIASANAIQTARKERVKDGSGSGSGSKKGNGGGTKGSGNGSGKGGKGSGGTGSGPKDGSGNRGTNPGQCPSPSDG